MRTRPHSYYPQNKSVLPLSYDFHTVYASSTIIHASSTPYTVWTIYSSDLTRLSIDVKLSVEPDFHISRTVRNIAGYPPGEVRVGDIYQVQSNITPSDLLTLDDSDLEIVNSPCQLNEIERLVQVEKSPGDRFG